MSLALSRNRASWSGFQYWAAWLAKMRSNSSVDRYSSPFATTSSIDA